jgi:hypothetical protein
MAQVRKRKRCTLSSIQPANFMYYKELARRRCFTLTKYAVPYKCVTDSARDAFSCVRPQKGVFRALFGLAAINHAANIPKPLLKGAA